MKMAWVKMIPRDDAEGLLKEVYEAAEKRAGYLPKMTQLQSLRPGTLNIGFMLYRQLMEAPGGLSRRQRVLIATVVSKTNGCFW